MGEQKTGSVAVEVRETCRVCGTDTTGESSWRDAKGFVYCDSCYQRLRTQPPYQTPLFKCGVCKRNWPVRMLEERDGELICKDCFNKPVVPKSQAVGRQNGLPATRPPSKSDNKSRQPKPAVKYSASAKAAFEKSLGPLPANLLTRITCPNCWHVFAPDRVLWVSQHAEMLGDPVLGPEEPVRFRASRFTALGHALDARDSPCQELACPRCHLTIPRAMLETTPLFVSVIGAPASGKSHFLASMTWELRRILNEHFGVFFNDADTVLNQSINEYEETLFLQHDRDKLVAIRKTEMQGDLYHQIHLGQQFISLPKPFLFTMRAAPRPGKRMPIRMLCIYDNAGEHFQPGMDTVSAPGTQHLAKSKVLMFLYDPTQNPRFKEQCSALSDDPQLHELARTQRQETVVTEAASRVRRYTGLSVRAKHNRALIIVVAKADIWQSLVDFSLNEEPLISTDSGKVVDVERIESVSAQLRSLLVKLTPEFVAAVEDFCHRVIYIPVSALGHGPELQKETGMLGIRPRDINPHWVTAPVLYMMAKWGGGLPAAGVAKAPSASGSSAESDDESVTPIDSAGDAS